jgi:hypothetical protein
MDQRDTTLAEVAARHLHLETLETRNSDSLDFHDMAVWSIKAALEAARKAGRQGRAPVRPKHRGKGGQVVALPITKWSPCRSNAIASQRLDLDRQGDSPLDKPAG